MKKQKESQWSQARCPECGEELHTGDRGKPEHDVCGWFVICACGTRVAFKDVTYPGGPRTWRVVR
jgi:hypothetical protein